MSTTITFNQERRLTERRFIHERRMAAERKRETQRVENSQRATNKYNLALNLLGSSLAVAASIMVLVFTGILSGATSTIAQIILIAVIGYAYVAAFRIAFYS